MTLLHGLQEFLSNVLVHRLFALVLDVDERADEVFVARGDRSEVVSDDGHVH